MKLWVRYVLLFLLGFVSAFAVVSMVSRQEQNQQQIALIDAQARLSACTQTNEQWRQWGQQMQAKLAAQQQQGAQISPDDVKMLLGLLKLLL